MGRTALDEAKEANIPWLVDLLMNPSLVQKEPFDWITACERSDEIPAVLAFIDNCRDLQRVCREQNDTPLHHIKLPSYKEYLNFLKIPIIAELKNTTDSEGATPLHIALKRKDMLLAKALLIDDGVERNVEDFHGKTAMHLLAELCKENDDWVCYVSTNIYFSEYMHAHLYFFFQFVCIYLANLLIVIISCTYLVG